MLRTYLVVETLRALLAVDLLRQTRLLELGKVDKMRAAHDSSKIFFWLK